MKSEARYQRQFALGVGPQRQCKKDGDGDGRMAEELNELVLVEKRAESVKEWRYIIKMSLESTEKTLDRAVSRRLGDFFGHADRKRELRNRRLPREEAAVDT